MTCPVAFRHVSALMALVFCVATLLPERIHTLDLNRNGVVDLLDVVDSIRALKPFGSSEERAVAASNRNLRHWLKQTIQVLDTATGKRTKISKDASVQGVTGESPYLAQKRFRLFVPIYDEPLEPDPVSLIRHFVDKPPYPPPRGISFMMMSDYCG